MFFIEFLCVLCFYVYTVIWAELPDINLMMTMMMMMITIRMAFGGALTSDKAAG